MGSITVTIRRSTATGIVAITIGRARRTREGRLGIDARRRSSALTSASAGGAPLASRFSSVVPDSGAAGSMVGATSCARDGRQQLDRTEMLIGVRCGQSGPRKIEEHELSVRPLPDVRESGPDVHLFANRGVEFDRQARERTMHLAPIGCRRRGQQWLAAWRLERVPILRRRSAAGEPVQPPGPRHVTAGRVDRRCALAELRESRHDGEGSDRRRRTIVRRRSRRPSCARRTVRRVARTKGRERDRQVTPSERRMRRAGGRSAARHAYGSAARGRRSIRCHGGRSRTAERSTAATARRQAARSRSIRSAQRSPCTRRPGPSIPSWRPSRKVWE